MKAKSINEYQEFKRGGRSITDSIGIGSNTKIGAKSLLEGAIDLINKFNKLEDISIFVKDQGKVKHSEPGDYLFWKINIEIDNNLFSLGYCYEEEEDFKKGWFSNHFAGHTFKRKKYFNGEQSFKPILDYYLNFDGWSDSPDKFLKDREEYLLEQITVAKELQKIYKNI